CLHTDHSFRLLGRPPSSPLFPYTTLFRSLLAAEHHLQAGLALVLGLGELHRRGEGVAVQIARLQFVARRRRIALGQRLEQLLERSEERRVGKGGSAGRLRLRSGRKALALV